MTASLLCQPYLFFCQTRTIYFDFCGVPHENSSSASTIYRKMFSKSAILLMCALGALAQGSVTENIIPPNSGVTFGPKNITTPITPTTTPNTTTTLTTSKPTTTASTTTPKPTTASTTTISTTKTTTAPTKPTPKPDDKPAVNDYVGNYTGTKNICLMVKVAVQVEVLAENKSSTWINIPKDVHYEASCPQHNFESLEVKWDSNNSVSFEFFRNNSRYEIHAVNATVPLAGATSPTNLHHLKPAFSVPEKMSYYCTRDEPLNLTDGKTNKTLAKIHFSHLQYQAFMNTTSPNYSSVWDCDGTNTPDIVPVVVGCVLAVLVVLMLVGYLLGRRRCQARGYLSM